MATPQLQMGYPQVMTQNVVYALPGRRALLMTETVAATFVISNDVSMGTTAPLALSAAGTAEVAGAFIKCTSGNVTVTIKPT